MDFYEQLAHIKEDKNLSFKDLGDIIGKSPDAFRMKFRRKGLNALEKFSILRHFDLLGKEYDNDTEQDVLEVREQISEFEKAFKPIREPDAHWYGVPNTMMVPMISHRAQAGFLSGWADDAATLEDYPKIPWEVDREYKGKYVCFEVTGDSMDDGSRESLIDGDVILCREVMQQHWRNRLHINQWDFVIAHKEKGIVVKRIVEHEVETGRLVLHSLNEMYDDYEVYMQDCIAIFNVVDVKRSRRR